MSTTCYRGILDKIASELRQVESKQPGELWFIWDTAHYGWEPDDGGNEYVVTFDILFSDGTFCRLIDKRMDKPWQRVLDIDYYSDDIRLDNEDLSKSEFIAWHERRRPRLSALTSDGGHIDWDEPFKVSESRRQIRPISTIVGYRSTRYEAWDRSN